MELTYEFFRANHDGKSLDLIFRHKCHGNLASQMLKIKKELNLERAKFQKSYSDIVDKYAVLDDKKQVVIDETGKYQVKKEDQKAHDDEQIKLWETKFDTSFKKLHFSQLGEFKISPAELEPIAELFE